VNSSSLNTQPADPFSEVLQRWYLPGWHAGLAEFDRPWGISVPQGLAALYVLLSGPCLLTLEEVGTQDQLQSGEVVLLPHGSAHRLRDKPDSPTTPFSGSFEQACHRPGCAQDLEPPTRLVFGCFSLESYGFQPVTSGLPQAVRLNADSFQALRGYRTIAQLVADEQAAAAPGWRTVVDRLVQILLVQTVRAFVVRDSSRNDLSQSARRTPWLAAALDEAIGPALGLIHSRPEAAWTVTSLAEQVHMSKSAFSERFREMVGKPPSHYLTEYRIRKACQLLRETRLGVKEISSHVGYESASSFSTAFKRCTGKGPAEFRKNGHTHQTGNTTEGI
jgi:AraC family transcriptional regulator, alkane utilization regulator